VAELDVLMKKVVFKGYAETRKAINAAIGWHGEIPVVSEWDY